MRRIRFLLLGLAAAIAFVIVATALLRSMPQPLRPVDFLMSGAVATLCALLVLFAGVMVTLKQKDVFFRRRRKPDPPTL